MTDNIKFVTYIVSLFLTPQQLKSIGISRKSGDRYARHRSYPEPGPFAQRLVEKGIALPVSLAS